MNNYCMTLPNYTIGERAYEDIYRFCSPFGKTAVMIGGKTALSVASEKIIANCGGISVSATAASPATKMSRYSAALTK